MKNFFRNVQIEIKEAEQGISLDSPKAIEESQRMTILLKRILDKLKDDVVSNGFDDEHQEIEFFKKIKPEVQGKLLYYNKVFRIETSRPVDMGIIYQTYFSKELERLENSFQEHISNSHFYRYYRSGSTKHDSEFFLRGKIDVNVGLKSYAFESDPLFSTYYDYKVSRIIENDLLYEYLLMRTDNDLDGNSHLVGDFGNDKFTWTDSKNALIELIYAVYAKKSIANGNVGIRKISVAFQNLFNIELGDVHHGFHRMKYRSGSRTVFLEKLKSSLDDYMDREFM